MDLAVPSWTSESQGPKDGLARPVSLQDTHKRKNIRIKTELIMTNKRNTKEKGAVAWREVVGARFSTRRKDRRHRNSGFQAKAQKGVPS